MIFEGFTGGGANNPYYDGQTLADEYDVVVVTIKLVLQFHFSPCY
jgi:carboxylesterase type B